MKNPSAMRPLIRILYGSETQKTSGFWGKPHLNTQQKPTTNLIQFQFVVRLKIKDFIVVKAFAPTSNEFATL